MIIHLYYAFNHDFNQTHLINAGWKVVA